MPSRKLTSHCHVCGCKNHLRAQFCNQCGKRVSQRESEYEDDGRSKLYADIAHPINTNCREMIQQLVIDEYEREVELADEPGYSHRYDEGYVADAREDRDEEEVVEDDQAPTEPQDDQPDSDDDPRAEENSAAPAGEESDPGSPPDAAEAAQPGVGEDASFGDGIL